MKKYLVIIITMVIALICGRNVWAENTHSLYLNGSSYIYINDSIQNNLDLSGDCSFERWIKVIAQPSNSSAFLYSKDQATSNRGYAIIYSDSNGTKKIRMQIFSTLTAINYSYADFEYTLTTNQWIHTSFIIRPNNPKESKFELIINGISQGYGTAYEAGEGATLIVNNSSPLIMGQNLQCLIDSNRIWNIARTPTNILSDYMKELTGTENGLVICSEFNENLTSSTGNNTLSVSGNTIYSDDVPFTTGATTETTTEETTTETTTTTCACTGELLLSKSATGLLTGNVTSGTVEFMDLGYNSEGAYTLCVSDTSGNTLSSTTLPEMAGYTPMAMIQKSSTSVVIATYSGTSRTIFTIDYSSDIPSISSANISN